MEEELDALSVDKQKLSTKLTQLQKELSQLSMYSSARGAIDGFKKQKKEKEDSYQLEWVPFLFWNQTALPPSLPPSFILPLSSLVD